MTARELYEAAIRLGRCKDPREDEALDQQLDDRRRKYEALTARDRLVYDRERLHNPFGDTRLAAGDFDRELSRVMVGIDLDVGEVALAHSLSQAGKPVDALIAHHASAIGGGVGSPEDTMNMQVAMLTRVGVSPGRARRAVEPGYGLHPRAVNYRINQAAEAAGIPLMTLHAPADACAYTYFHELAEREGPETLGDLVELCDAQPEIAWFVERGLATEIAVGKPGNALGRVFYGFYGGWLLSVEGLNALCDAGVGTFISVATTPEHNRLAAQRGLNIVVAPHYACDAIGLNLLFDALMPRQVEYVETSNFVRVARTG